MSKIEQDILAEIFKKRKEVISATYELDILNNTICEWRSIKTQIEADIVNGKEELAKIYSLIGSAKQELSTTTTHTEHSIEEKNKILLELDEQIEKRQNELAKQEWKTLIDIDSENAKLKKILTAKKEQIQRIENTIIEKKVYFDSLKKQMKKERNEIEKEKEYIIKQKIGLKVKENMLSVKEKHINKARDNLFKK